MRRSNISSVDKTDSATVGLLRVQKHMIAKTGASLCAAHVFQESMSDLNAADLSVSSIR